jgi:hypothetical protein
MAVDHPLTEFLLSHDTVEELSLAKSLSFDASLLNASALPRLRSFKGSSHAFDTLVRAGMAGTLQQLNIYFIPSTSACVQRIFTILQSSQGLTVSVPSCPPMLRHIGNRNCNMPVSLLMEIVCGCARLFGSMLEELNELFEDLERGQIMEHVSTFRDFKSCGCFVSLSDAATRSLPGDPEASVHSVPRPCGQCPTLWPAVRSLRIRSVFVVSRKQVHIAASTCHR